MKDSSNKLIKQIIIAVSVILGLLILDIVTKLVVYFHFEGHEGSEIEVIKDFFWIHLTFNRGAAFSILANVTFGRVLLSILSLIGSGLSIWYLVMSFKKLKLIYKIALFLFIPGCTGNLIDRVGIYQTPGVIDFLSFKLFGFYYFPVFNVADACLTLSIVVFAIGYIFFSKDLEEETEEKVNEDIPS